MEKELDSESKIRKFIDGEIEYSENTWEKQFGDMCIENQIEVHKLGHEKLRALNEDKLFKPLIIKLKDFIDSNEINAAFQVYGQNFGIFVEKKNKVLKEEIKNIITQYFDKKDLAKQLIKIQPIYYDTSKNWWMWDHKNFCWILTDETDILNSVADVSAAPTVNSKERTEIIEALKQEARRNKPKEIPRTWIQFKDTVFDVITGEEFKANPEYFVTNPIPWNLQKDKFESTPNFDRLFEEWVGKDHAKTLYEILAFCLLPDYPLHRIFCFIGSGLNGKGCYLRILEKFIGKNNITSTELDTLLASKFEVTRLHKKLACVMGETNFAEMSKTSMLKKLSGGDLIGFEYKNKNPFEDYNYAKIIIATNNLPTTTDKTLGFYRRWMIIDFPNTFSEEKDILDSIPKEEYEALALKCCSILSELIKTRKFHNEGSIEDRMLKYEAKSNFLEQFIKKHTSQDVNGYITCTDFFKKFNSWCKENRHRETSETSLGMDMKKLGIEQDRKYFSWMNEGKGGTGRCWVGITWKT